MADNAQKKHVELDSKKSSDAKVAFATVASTSLEWYDVFIFAFAAGTVVNAQFLKPLGEDG